MKIRFLFFPATFLFSILFSCKQEHFKPDFANAGGYVIGKEKCNIDSTLDSWLVDLSIFPVSNNYGDTFSFNGNNYYHVVKTTGIDSQLKHIGAKIDFDFRLSNSRIQSANCNVSNPATYFLKQMEVIHQAEIR